MGLSPSAATAAPIPTTPGGRATPAIRPYRRRTPEDSVLYQVVREHLNTFIERAAAADGIGLPSFVERELRAYVDCGVLARGFARMQCADCRRDQVIALSCKGRGFCPSCCGRRMTDTAAHLVDNVIPDVPIRQWVLSLPFRLRYRLAYDADLKRQILACFLKAVFAWYERWGGRWGAAHGQTGAATYGQRFGGSININVHFHAIVLDGVFHRPDPDADVRFLPLPPPTDDDILAVTIDTYRRVTRLLRRRDIHLWDDPFDDTEGDGDAGYDPLAEDSPALAHFYAAAVQGTLAFHTDPTRPTRRQRTIPPDHGAHIPVPGELRARLEGFDLHAGVAIPQGARDALEHLCRYIARPPVATDRLDLLPTGEIAYRLRRPWSDGTTTLVFAPLDLVARLAALVPYPGKNSVHYHGVFAPRHAWRSEIVPRPPTGRAPGEPDPPPGGGTTDEHPRGRLPRAELLRRVFGIDAERCPHCGGRLRLLAFITEQSTIRTILQAMNLPADPPQLAPARAPPMLDTMFDDVA